MEKVVGACKGGVRELQSASAASPVVKNTLSLCCWNYLHVFFILMQRMSVVVDSLLPVNLFLSLSLLSHKL